MSERNQKIFDYHADRIIQSIRDKKREDELLMQRLSYLESRLGEAEDTDSEAPESAPSRPPTKPALKSTKTVKKPTVK